MKKITPSERSKHVKYAIRDIAVAAKNIEKTKKVIYLNIGDPNKYDFDTPPELIEAVYKAMKNNKNYYSDSIGESEAIEAIIKHSNKLGFDITSSDILMTFGVSEAINLCIAALLNRDDSMLIPRPSYPIYSTYLDLFEIEKRFYTLDEKNEWELNPEEIEKRIKENTKALVIINPNNPTGGIYDKKTLKEIINIAGQHNLIIFSDEIYDELILEGEMHHIASFSNEVPVITFNGLAKNFLAPGWRIGWLTITDREKILEDYKQALFQLARARLCISTPQQFAVKVALESNRSHLKETIEKLRKRRDLTFKRINEIDGLNLKKPKAAFYAFPKINFNIDDKKFVLKLLEEEGVATVYGSGFDMPGYFRIVYLPTEEILNEAFDKIEKFVKRYKT
ncbi:MAG: aminotransferase class I/II-fold pyridoxal phosphate-dependent enzyme [Candidatus Aenigmatarchaeota archaeon]